MKPQEITAEDIAERDEYCSVKRLRTLMKRKTFEQIMAEDPIMYFTHEFGMKPLAWQFKVLQSYNEGNRKFAVCTSRQIGKSALAQGLASWRKNYNRGWFDRQTMTNRKQTTAELVVSITEQQAFKFMGEIKQYEYMGDKSMERWGAFGKRHFSNRISKGSMGNNRSMITNKSNRWESKAGCYIKSLPPTDSIRGETFTGVILDEVAFIPDEVITSVINPTLKQFGRFQMLISTPNRPDGYFYNRIDPDERDTSDDFKRFMFDIHAIKDELPESYAITMKDIESMIRDGKENQVQREYFCSFTSSDELYFPPDKIKDVFHDDIQKLDHYRERPVVLGVDFGGLSASHSVITVSTHPDDAGVSERIFAFRYPIRQDGDIIRDIEYNFLPNFNVTDIVVDLCPASNITVQKMKEKSWPVNEFQFTRTSKQDYMDRFRKRLSRKASLTYPDPHIKDEFANYGDLMKPMNGATDDLIDSWMLSNVPFMETKVNFGAYVLDPPADSDEEAARLALKQGEIQNKSKSTFIGMSTVI